MQQTKRNPKSWQVLMTRQEERRVTAEALMVALLELDAYLRRN